MSRVGSGIAVAGIVERDSGEVPRRVEQLQHHDADWATRAGNSSRRSMRKASWRRRASSVTPPLSCLDRPEIQQGQALVIDCRLDRDRAWARDAHVQLDDGIHVDRPGGVRDARRNRLACLA